MQSFRRLFVAACFILIVFVSAGMAQSAARQAVVHQALYALNTSANGECAQSTCFGTWNWLDSDFNSYNTVKNWYNYYQNGGWTCYASDWGGAPGDPCPNAVSNPKSYPVPDFYTQPSLYGHSVFEVPEVPYGRGGQCAYFANLVVYRSKVYEQAFPSLPNMWASGNSSMQAVQVGDVIQRYNVAGLTNHIAIVVAAYKSGNTVTSVDVVDSNWLTDTALTLNHEVIGRHNFPMANLQGYFRIWKVPGY